MYHIVISTIIVIIAMLTLCHAINVTCYTSFFYHASMLTLLNFLNIVSTSMILRSLKCIDLVLLTFEHHFDNQIIQLIKQVLCDCAMFI